MPSDHKDREREASLSAYIDSLNRGRTPAAHRLGLPQGQGGLYAAVRSVKRLRNPVPPRTGLERRLLQSAGVPVSASRRQAGLIKAASVLVLAGLAVLVALLVLSGARPGPAVDLLDEIMAMEADPAAAGLSAYSGRIRSVGRGEFELLFMAPDKRWIREVGSSRTYGTNGQVFWCYDSDNGVACVSQQVGGWWSFLLGPGQPFTKWNHFGAATADQGTSAWLVGEDMVVGRMTRVLEVRLSRGWGAKTVAPGPAVARFWIDAETYLVLKEGQPLPDGQLLDVTEFTALDLTPEIDPAIFDPVFPEGTTVLVCRTGELADLAREVGWAVREPQGLPGTAEPAHTYLTLYPENYPDQSWELTWDYPRLFEEGFSIVSLRVSVSDRDGGVMDAGQSVTIAAEVTGFHAAGTLTWQADGLRYQLSCPALSAEELAELAATMVAGQ